MISGVNPLYTTRIDLASWLRRHPSARRRAVRACIAFVVSFPAVLVATSVATDVIWPDRIDPDYHYRGTLLASRVAASPGHRIALVVGSSRTAHGFRPEVADPTTDAAGRPVLWFNYSHVGYGPVMNRIVLGRMARDGVRPDTVVLEINPSMFVKEDSRFQAGHIAATELSTLRRFAPPLAPEWAYLRTRPDRLKSHRFFGDPLDGVARLGPYGGWTRYDPDEVSDAKRDERLVTQRAILGSYLARVKARQGAIAALRECVASCRSRGIELVLLRMPEGPVFRSWYGVEPLAAFDQWCMSFAADEGVRVLDARDWLGEDGFNDSHHANRRGADAFSKRFVRELTPTLGR
jgi:hypothetical protein